MAKAPTPNRAPAPAPARTPFPTGPIMSKAPPSNLSSNSSGQIIAKPSPSISMGGTSVPTSSLVNVPQGQTNVIAPSRSAPSPINIGGNSVPASSLVNVPQGQTRMLGPTTNYSSGGNNYSIPRVSSSAPIQQPQDQPKYSTSSGYYNSINSGAPTLNSGGNTTSSFGGGGYTAYDSSTTVNNTTAGMTGTVKDKILTEEEKKAKDQTNPKELTDQEIYHKLLLQSYRDAIDPAPINSDSAQTTNANNEYNQALQADQNQQNAYMQGRQNLSQQVIPMEFITGQQKNLEERNNLASIPLQQRVANAQAQRQAAMDNHTKDQEMAFKRKELQQKAQATLLDYHDKVEKNAINSAQNKLDLKNAGTTSDQKNYEYAKKAGYKGSFIDYQKGSGLTDAQVNSTVNQIAGGFDNEPIVKNHNVIKEGYEFAKSLSDSPNPTSAGDQGLVYAFAKAMDPSSAVREGEYSTVQKYNQSLIQSGWANAQRIVSNVDFLTPAARANMVSAIKSKYEASQNNYNNISKEYQRQIDDAYAGKKRKITDYSGQGNSSKSGPIGWDNLLD